MSDTMRNRELAALLLKAYRALSDAPHTSIVDSAAYHGWYRSTRRDAVESCDPDRWQRHDDRKGRA